MIKTFDPNMNVFVDIMGDIEPLGQFPKVEDLQKITVVPAVSSEFPNKHDIPKDLGEYTWSQPNYWTG